MIPGSYDLSDLDTKPIASFVDALGVGHQPPHTLSIQDTALFRAFQRNLLSLISHELRTPLSGILNSLSLLEEGADEVGMSQEELIRMARSNAQRLHRTLVTLLDLASIESGTFHARMKEIDLARLTKARLSSNATILEDRFVQIVLNETASTPLLGDPQRLSRAIDLTIQVMAPRIEPESKLFIDISQGEVKMGFTLSEGVEKFWEQAWSQARTGFESGVASPASAFGGVLQSEQAFLTRMEEGLGSEFLLILEIMKLHRGEFHVERKARHVKLKLSIPELSSEEGLRSVLSSRAFQVSTELGSVALVLIDVPPKKDAVFFCAEIKENLFRSSDAVYPLPARNQAALVLDDCKPEDAPRLVERLKASLGQDLHFGMAHCPLDAHDPDRLLDLASERMKSKEPI